MILLILFTRHKRFDGEVFLLYLAGYGHTTVSRIIDGLAADDDHHRWRGFSGQTPEEIRTRQGYLAQLRFRDRVPLHGRTILYPETAVAEWIDASRIDVTKGHDQCEELSHCHSDGMAALLQENRDVGKCVMVLTPPHRWRGFSGLRRPTRRASGQLRSADRVSG